MRTEIRGQQSEVRKQPTVLHLTLHRKWFDEIASGRKKREYRDATPYWDRRIRCRLYTEVHFRNGYAKDAPFMRVEFKGYLLDKQAGKWVYVLYLGKVLELRNWKERC